MTSSPWPERRTWATFFTPPTEDEIQVIVERRKAAAELEEILERQAP